VLSQETLAADQRSVRLTSAQRRAGTVSALDQIQSRTSVDSTRATVARYQRQVAQDLNQLTLLVGTPV
ncbi:MAG TPA: multidrug transporter, partial [Pseudomonas sp.]|nr:multidrug transporter [Pseudomonas sp.]